MSIICPELFDFISANISADPMRLRLRHHGAQEPPWISLALNHLEALKKCGRKFGNLHPELIGTPVSVEQASSGAVARLHGAIARRIAPDAKSFLDMTCGLGVDFAAITEALGPGCRATAVEMQPLLAEVAAYNFRTVGNAEIITADSVQWLAASEAHFDLVFIDPARRDSTGRRLYNIHDCAPDVAEILPLIAGHSRRLMVKLSPMLDVTQTLRDLPCAELHVVDEGGECRELLAVVDFTATPPQPDDVPVTVHSGTSAPFTFTRAEEHAAEPMYAAPQAGMWLFEPSAALMKAAPFSLLCARERLVKLAPNTHLYAAPSPAEHLPGRWQKIEEVIAFTSSAARDFGRRRMSADVAVRNFPMRAEQLAARLRVTPGGSRRITGATAADGSRMLVISLK